MECLDLPYRNLDKGGSSTKSRRKEEWDICQTGKHIWMLMSESEEEMQIIWI